MKIIFSSYDDLKNPYYGGGGALAVHEIAKRLAVNYDVTVITGTYPGSKNENIDGVNYKRIGLFSNYPKLAQFIFQLFLPFYTIKNNYDIWIENFTPPFSTAFLPLFTRKPVIGLTQLLGGRAMYNKYHFPFHWIESFGLKCYKHVIVLNKSLEGYIKKINKNIDITIIPNGITKQYIEDEFEKKGEYLLFLGRIDYIQKGLDLLLDAYYNICKQININLIIAGDGKEKDKKLLISKIATLGLQKKIKVIGKVSGLQKIDTFKKAKLFLMTSRYEALPISLVEAMAYKNPVIYFGIDDLKWIPEDIGIQVESFNVSQFGEAVLNLVKNEPRINDMGEKAKSYSKGFNWDDLANKYKLYINSIYEK